MKEIGVICILPETVRQYQRELRQKIEMKFGLPGIANPSIPGHITLKYRFPVGDLDELEAAIQEFSTSERKASWALQSFSYFKNEDDYVIFIDVKPSEEARQLHARFLDRLRKISWVQWGPFDHANLHYHVTLAGRGVTSVNFEEVWSFMRQQENPDFEVFLDNLSLIRIDENSHSMYKIYWLHD